MIYPKNLKPDYKTSAEELKEYWKEIGYQLKHKMHYFAHDRNNFFKRIMIKFHM